MKQLSILATALAIAAGQTYIGRLDTIGGTTHDWWANANVHRSLVNSPRFGIHASWMISTATSGTDFPDRNINYNFYSYMTRQWNWIDPDHMQSGVNVFPVRAGYGVIDADSAGRVSVAANTGSGLVIAQEASPGAGIFRYSAPLPGYSGPDMAIGDDGTYHVMVSSASYELGYSRIRTWGDWDSVRSLPSTSFPAYAISACKTAPSVCAAWVDDPHFYYLLSQNRGDTWSSPIELEPPPAFGGDTITVFSYYGMFAFADRENHLHFVVSVRPVWRDTGYVVPSQIWHYCPDNTPQWSRIHIASCRPEHMQASVGYNAVYADRPSMGEGNDGRLYVAWEQFDSSNVEPTTSRLRAGIWVSSSPDNGAGWTPGQLVTERNTFSHRFPCVIDRMVAGDPDDTVCVLYLKDSVAGFFVQNEGPATPNPVICQFFVLPPPGVAAQRIQSPSIYKMTPTIVRGVLKLGADSGQHLACREELLDAAGRKVLDLRPGANDVSRFPRGVYFVRAAGREPSAVSCSKILVVR